MREPFLDSSPRESSAERQLGRSSVSTQGLTAPVVWAVDALAESYERHFQTAAALVAAYPHAPIFPVFVVNADVYNQRTFLKPAVKPAAIRSMRELGREFPELQLMRGRVLLERKGTRTACARRLLRFSSRIGATAIAVSTRGRGAFKKLFTGSFSEAMLESEHPTLLVTGPKSEMVDSSPRAIVFPTDFSEASSRAFDEVLALAAHLGASVELYHRSEHPIDPLAQSGVGFFGAGWMAVEPFIDMPTPDHESDVRDWQKRAHSRGVALKFVRENYGEPTSEAIVHYLSTFPRGAVIVAMVSHSGALASALLGSVTREVIRNAPCPIYVCAKTVLV